MKKLFFFLYFCASYVLAAPDVGFVDERGNTFALIVKVDHASNTVKFILTQPVSEINISSANYSIALFRTEIGNSIDDEDLLDEFFRMLEESFESKFKYKPEKFLRALENVLTNVPKCLASNNDLLIC